MTAVLDAMVLEIVQRRPVHFCRADVTPSSRRKRNTS